MCMSASSVVALRTEIRRFQINNSDTYFLSRARLLAYILSIAPLLGGTTRPSAAPNSAVATALVPVPVLVSVPAAPDELER